MVFNAVADTWEAQVVTISLNLFWIYKKLLKLVMSFKWIELIIFFCKMWKNGHIVKLVTLVYYIFYIFCIFTESLSQLDMNSVLLCHSFLVLNILTSNVPCDWIQQLNISIIPLSLYEVVSWITTFLGGWFCIMLLTWLYNKLSNAVEFAFITGAGGEKNKQNLYHIIIKAASFLIFGSSWLRGEQVYNELNMSF